MKCKVSKICNKFKVEKRSQTTCSLGLCYKFDVWLLAYNKHIFLFLISSPIKEFRQPCYRRLWSRSRGRKEGHNLLDLVLLLRFVLKIKWKHTYVHLTKFYLLNGGKLYTNARHCIYCYCCCCCHKWQRHSGKPRGLIKVERNKWPTRHHILNQWE